MRSVIVFVVVVLVAGVIPAAFGDIVVFRDGTFEDAKIKSVTDDLLTIEGEYGDLPYPRERVYWFSQAVPERPGIEYYLAGLKLLELHKKHMAAKLFEKAGQYDRRYAQAGEKALQVYTPQRPTDTASRLEAPPSGDAHSRVPVYKVQCKLCQGTGKVEATLGGDLSLLEDASFTGGATQLSCGPGGGGSGGGSKDKEDHKMMITCPACGGKGYRLLRLGPKDGICPKCGGAGSINEEKEGSWTFNFVPCPECAGRGIKPIKDGGARVGIVLASSSRPPGGPSGGGDDEYDGSEKEADEDKEPSSSDDRSFFDKYKVYFLAGGGALLIVAFVASKASKKR